MKFLLIDGSYFNFFRYFAMQQWWSLAKKDEELGLPIENQTFVDKYKTTFVNKISEIEKKLKLKGCIKIVGKDCPRKNIWRHELYGHYKEGRDNGKEFHGKPFFKMAYSELFEKAGIKAILSYPKLEADDVIAITTKHIIENYPDSEVTIIASDMDYLQLASDRVKIFTLKYKDISKSKNAIGDSECDKFCKIVAGDKSDNIPSVFPKCGIKTALKYYNNKELFNEKLNNVKNAKEIFERNRKLVDFNCIPDNLRKGFMKEVLGITC
jgi:5'-3' exonuclease